MPTDKPKVGRKPRKRRKENSGGKHLFLRNIPPEVKNHFKAYCAARGISMRDRILWLIKNDLKAGKAADLFFD